MSHGVLVGFEKSKGNLFGLSNEPFVNKPARHPEHDKDNEQLRNHTIATALHDALEEAQKASSADVYKGLVHILRIGSQNAAKEKKVIVKTKTSLQPVVTFVNEFLKESDGGARLVGVWGAFTALLAEEAEVKVYSPNAADLYSKTAGDVEVRSDKVLVSASECKQRPLTLDDVKHGVKKATDKGVPEYIFVISAGITAKDEKEVHKFLYESANTLDLALVNITEQAPRYASMLNPSRRAKFGLEVVRLLREMRKFESANAAATLWNVLTEKG